MAEYDAKFVKCPFYLERQNDKNRIKCEGVIEGTTLQLTFVGEKKWYIKGFCCKNFEKCRIYRMLYAKYEKTK